MGVQENRVQLTHRIELKGESMRRRAVTVDADQEN
jgi:hypothetical protein